MSAPAWQPVAGAERHVAIDVLRGVALFGVLLVNLMGAFRVPLFAHMIGAADQAGPTEQAIEALIALLVEFKAFTLFSFLFGVGAAIQSERAAARGVRVRPFLARRFAILFLFGLAHIVFVWNGDILALYGVCGLLLAALIGTSNTVLCSVGAALILLPQFVPLPLPWPSTEVMRADVRDALRIYATGGYIEILVFRCKEAWGLVVPLWLASLPRTAGLMLLGVAAWRSGVLTRDRVLMKRVVVWAGAIGVGATCFRYSPWSRYVPGGMLELGAILGLAFAYGAAVLLWLPRVRPLAALGQMALTNYLMESVILVFVFYGFGLGLFGKMSAPMGVLLAAGLYAAQAAASVYWLRRFRYGPFEWVWRSLTYGKAQRMRAAKDGVANLGQ